MIWNHLRVHHSWTSSCSERLFVGTWQSITHSVLMHIPISRTFFGYFFSQITSLTHSTIHEYIVYVLSVRCAFLFALCFLATLFTFDGSHLFTHCWYSARLAPKGWWPARPSIERARSQRTGDQLDPVFNAPGAKGLVASSRSNQEPGDELESGWNSG